MNAMNTNSSTIYNLGLKGIPCVANSSQNQAQLAEELNKMVEKFKI